MYSNQITSTVSGGGHGFGTGIPRIFVDVVFIYGPIVNLHFQSGGRASGLFGEPSSKSYGRSNFWIFTFALSLTIILSQ